MMFIKNLIFLLILFHGVAGSQYKLEISNSALIIIVAIFACFLIVLITKYLKSAKKAKNRPLGNNNNEISKTEYPHTNAEDNIYRALYDFLHQPNTEKRTLNGEGNGLKFGFSSMQGWRVEMEDAHEMQIRLPHPLLNNWSYFAVFDGHAGSRVSFYCSKQLLLSIVNNLDFNSVNSDHSINKSDSSNDTSNKRDELSPECVKAGIRTGFLSLDDKILKVPKINNGKDESGTTAICALISPKHIYLANCGDSRAVLSRDGKVAVSTIDHKPTRESERRRIKKAGGRVESNRVNGVLDVSRGLGDFKYKNITGIGQCEQPVSPEPEIFVEERHIRDEFLVLACDGIWNIMKNDQLCDFVRDRLAITDDLCNICDLVVDTCLLKGSSDNMSIIIITFEGAPRVSADAQLKDKLLNEQIEEEIKRIYRTCPGEVFKFKDFLKRLSKNKRMDKLIESKIVVVAEIISRLTGMKICQMVQLS